MFVIYLLSLFYTNFLQKKRRIFFFKFELYKNRISSIINLDNKTRGSLYMKKNIKHFLFLAAAAGTGIHLMNRTVNRTACMKEILSSHPGHYYDWKHGRIYYTKTGSGAPLLLIHDLHPASSSYEWSRMMKKLEKTNTVYTIDLLGCGRSDKPNITYTNYLYVELITNFIKHIIGEKTDVIVSGESCPFVLMACANDETIINKVIMINPPNLVDLAKIPTKRSKFIKNILYSPILGTFIYNMYVNKKTIAHALCSSYYTQNEISEKDILTYFEAAHKEHTNSKYLFACQKTRYTNANVLHCLNKLNNSISIIVGNSNPENSLAASEYQNYLPSIEIAGMAKTKQLPHIEKCDEFIENVEIFLSDAEECE